MARYTGKNNILSIAGLNRMFVWPNMMRTFSILQKLIEKIKQTNKQINKQTGAQNTRTDSPFGEIPRLALALASAHADPLSYQPK